MPSVRLIREVTQPGNSGPQNGQYALQKALRATGPEWLSIGGPLQEAEIPWIWCWKDRELAARCAAVGQPFVVGPNVLFANSREPCKLPAERVVCRAETCRLMFTESAWYRDLIEQHRGRMNVAPIVLWPYPIDPRPGGPLPPKFDLLIYAKSGYSAGLIASLQALYPRSALVLYGDYRRGHLFALARRSRACAYLSDDDRGPLALAEILLSGCPTIGLPNGAPFVCQGHTGISISRFDPQICSEAIRACHELDRHAVAAAAADEFDTARIVHIVVTALRRIAVTER